MEKGIRGRGMKRERDIAERKASAPTSRPWLSVAGPLPALGAPGLWPYNEGLFEFTFKQRLEKQCPTGYFY